MKYVSNFVEKEIDDVNIKVDAVRNLQKTLIESGACDVKVLPKLYQHKLILDLNEKMNQK